MLQNINLKLKLMIKNFNMIQREKRKVINYENEKRAILLTILDFLMLLIIIILLLFFYFFMFISIIVILYTHYYYYYIEICGSESLMIQYIYLILKILLIKPKKLSLNINFDHLFNAILEL